MSQNHFTSSATTNTTVDVQRSVKTHKSMSGLHEKRSSEKVLSPKHRKTSLTPLPPTTPPVPLTSNADSAAKEGSAGAGGGGGGLKASNRDSQGMCGQSRWLPPLPRSLMM